MSGHDAGPATVASPADRHSPSIELAGTPGCLNPSATVPGAGIDPKVGVDEPGQAGNDALLGTRDHPDAVEVRGTGPLDPAIGYGPGPGHRDACTNLCGTPLTSSTDPREHRLLCRRVARRAAPA